MALTWGYEQLGLADLNHALVAAIMAQKMERDRHSQPVTNVATMATTLATTTEISTTPSTTTSTVTVTLAPSTQTINQNNQLIEKIVTASVFLLLQILMVVAYIILINHNKISYKKRMTYILVLICPFQFIFGKNSLKVAEALQVLEPVSK